MEKFDIGVISGFFGGLIAVALMVWLKKRRLKKQGKNSGYDERQRMVQLKSAGIASLVYIWLTFSLAIIADSGRIFFENRFTEIIFVLIISAIVYVVYNIFHDSYYSLRDNPVKFSASFILVAVIFAVSSGKFIYDGKMLSDGKLTVFASYLLIVLMAVMVSVSTLIRMKINQKAEDSEDE